MPFATVQGRQIYYQESANAGEEGRTVILAHGSGGTGRKWAAQLKGITGHRIIAPDLPGHGQSEGSAHDSIAAYREFIFDFASALEIRRFVIGGHSLGGGVALDFALVHPELLEGTILVGSGGRLRVRPEFLEALAKGEYPAGIIESMYSGNAPGHVLDEAAGEMKSVSPEVFLADFTACDRFDVLDRLERIAVPTLVICGEEDRMTPVKYSEYLSGHIPDAKLALAPNAGHMAMLEQPLVVNGHIKAFLDALIV